VSIMKSIRKKRLISILKFCVSGAVLERSTGKGEATIQKLVRSNSTSLKITSFELELLVGDDLLTSTNNHWSTSATGKACLRRLLSQVDEFQEQHQQVGEKTIAYNGHLTRHRYNHAESPLSRLRYRVGSGGEPYLDETSFQAGEKLRGDFSRGQLVKQLTSNWSTTSIGGSGSNNGMQDLTDTALAARRRFESALNALGPELTGVMVDVCCFVKGLELVERERKWPPRSAKLMLKTGLSILARHYGLQACGRRTSSTRHWGAKEYRPAGFLAPLP